MYMTALPLPLPLGVVTYVPRVRIIEDYKIGAALAPEQINQYLCLRGIVCGTVVIHVTGHTVRVHRPDVGCGPLSVTGLARSRYGAVRRILSDHWRGFCGATQPRQR